MPRIRAIYPQFKHDAKVKRCSRDARLTFLLMLPEADDEGRMPGSGKWLAGTLYEDDDDVTSAKVTRWLTELVREGLVTPYEVDGAKYLHVTNFNRYQHPKNPTRSKLPAPPGEEGTTPATTPLANPPPTPPATPASGVAPPPLEIRDSSSYSPQSYSDSRPPPATGADDEEASHRNGSATCEAAFAWLGRYDLSRAQSAGVAVRNPEKWLVTATDRRRAEHCDLARELAAKHPDWTGERLAKELAGRDPNAPAGEATVAAARALMDRQALPPCADCDSTGWTETDAGSVPCRSCERVNA